MSCATNMMTRADCAEQNPRGRGWLEKTGWLEAGNIEYRNSKFEIQYSKFLVPIDNQMIDVERSLLLPRKMC